MTIRIIPALGPLPEYFSASCVRCGQHVADFHDPERADEAIEHYGGEIVASKHYIDDCIVACAACKDKCLCPKCGRVLDADLCPDCRAPQDIREFIEMYPGGEIPGMSVIACAIVIDIGNGELVALGESTGYVWGRIQDYSYPVAGVLYAGDNQAIQTSEAWDKKYHEPQAIR
jgi:hypothetical protein